MFDFELEIQCIYVEYEHVEPRLLSIIQSRLRSDARIEGGIAVVASLDPDLSQMASRRRGEFGIIDVHLPSLASDSRDLRSRLATVVTSVDHYDVTYPIREPSGFFGRRREFDELTQSLDRGQSVGLFGLRKAGKTSLMNYVRRVREEGERLVVNLDMSQVSGASDFRWKLVIRAFTALQNWRNSVEASGKIPVRIPKLRVVTREGSPKGSIEELGMFWTEDLAAIAQARGQRLELFVDEVDQAFPERSNFGEEEAEKLVLALTQLRGLIQQEEIGSPAIVLLCAGVDPAIFERALLGRRDNLLYKLVRLVFLVPMNREDTAEMVRSLGRRMGLRYSDYRTIDALYSEYGGHPLLTRKACSLAVRDRNPQEIPWHVPLEAIEAAIKLTGDGSPQEQALDIFDSFSQWFPDEASVLRVLWSDDAEEREYGKELVEDDPNVIEHAKPYGIANDDFTPRIQAIRAALGVE
ncbi:hypothetical protein [Actinoplanes philippinensis]|uniref:hypothetical protein n=1 Tax=Actinoplanes philippinensis TaxID=35752 RepID=UPI0033DC7F1C